MLCEASDCRQRTIMIILANPKSLEHVSVNLLAGVEEHIAQLNLQDQCPKCGLRKEKLYLSP